MPSTTGYRLVRTPLPAPAAPVLDPSQQAVVDHLSGPLLVLAGPGTGKTTTLVEAVLERVRRGLRPEQVLVLTFSRKAAGELRERITARLGRTVSEPSAWTFHSFCFALVCAYAGEDGSPRLLSGPERLVRVRELLAGHAEGQGSTRWPGQLRRGLATRGFAREVADLLDRARERALEPAALRRLGEAADGGQWPAVADFFEEYLAVLGGREMDYAELVRRVLLLLDDDTVLADVRDRWRAVFVDEYQDTDPAQEELLRLLAGHGRDLVVLGDPDQSIYAFRGADVSGLLRFPDRFPRADGEPAAVRTLRVSRRAGPELLRASRDVAVRIPAPGLPPAQVRAHRDLRPLPDAAPGSVQVRLFASGAEEAAAVADLLRRAHLEEGLHWSDMAVLVRSGVRSLPVLRRALVAAGVPVAVAADEVPVAADPAAAPLLLALRCAADPGALTAEAARTLLTSPLGRALPADLRRLGRSLRALDLDAADADGPRRPPRPSAVLIRAALADPRELTLVDERTARPVRRVAELLRRGAAVLGRHGGAEEALWEIWHASGWPRRLADASLVGGASGRTADRDLDAVVALFDAVARLEERQPRAGVAVLLDELEAQEIPAESRQEGSLAAGVRLLTAHRSKGLEWELVVVAGVQDGVWPDLRRRSSLLQADRLAGDGLEPAPTTTTLLTDERRLFYVAVTRARRRLVVTAVQSPTEDGERPSPFLEELGIPLPPVTASGEGTLSLPSLVARLRRATLDPATSEPLRRAAAGQLARLAAPGPDGAPLVPSAHPAHWWGMAEDTPGAHPVRPPDEPVRLSGSVVSGYDRCALAWFLGREVQATSATSAAQGFGSVLHVLARLVSTGALPADVDVLLERLDEVWSGLGFEATWQSERERHAAREALGRFLSWYAANPRRHLASERSFDVSLRSARLVGCVDRIDLDVDAGVHVVDYKTGRNKPAKKKVAADPQLGVYQLAVREGGFADLVGGQPVLGGAELVQLRDGRAGGRADVQTQGALTPDADGWTWADRLVARTAAGLLAEAFPARVNEGCSRCPFRRCCPAHDAGQQVVR